MRSARIKLLAAVGGRHRYARLRRATIALSLALLLAVPLSGLARVDLAGGEHVVLGERAGLVTALGTVVVAILSFYIMTLLINVVLGRVFCGWGCPIGEGSRLADGVEAAPRGRRLLRELGSAGYSLALAGAFSLWWISPRAFVRGNPWALGAWLGGAGLLWLHGRFWRWSFCRSFCPIGVYYSAVQTKRGFGVHFDPDACIQCDACARICPVALDPRDLSVPIDGLGGLSVDGMPSRNHCLACGDCVRACELVLKKRPPPRPPLRLGGQP